MNKRDEMTDLDKQDSDFANKWLHADDDEQWPMAFNAGWDAALKHSPEVLRLVGALDNIYESRLFTRLADCCVERTCHINEESGLCSFQTGVNYANCDRAADAELALSAWRKSVGEKE